MRVSSAVGPRRRFGLRAWIGWMAVAVGTACASPAPGGRQGTVDASYDPDTGRLRVLAHDLDGNGVDDRWLYMDGTRVLRAEVDEDEDGVTERWEYYATDRSLERVGLSSRRDGRLDTWVYPNGDGAVVKVERLWRQPDVGAPAADAPASGERLAGPADDEARVVLRREFYERGALVRAEEDGNRDGAMDKWESFSEGQLRSVALDLQGLGRPTRQLLYAPDGSLDRIESLP